MSRNIILGLMAVALAPNALHAYAWSSSAQYGQWTQGSYTVYTDEWGSSSLLQTVYANSSTNFWATSHFPGGGGVKAYPNSARTINESTSSRGGTLSYNVSLPSASNHYWDVSLDAWTPREVMVWVNYSGDWGSGSLVYTNQSIDGTTYDVSHVSGGVTTFYRRSQNTSGSFHPGTFYRWVISQGWNSSGTVSSEGFGFEIFGDNGVSGTYTVNSMSIGL